MAQVDEDSQTLNANILLQIFYSDLDSLDILIQLMTFIGFRSCFHRVRCELATLWLVYYSH